MIFQNSRSGKLVPKTCPQREWEALKRSWCEELEEERDFCARTFDESEKKIWVGEEEKNWKAGYVLEEEKNEQKGLHLLLREKGEEEGEEDRRNRLGIFKK